MCFVLSYMAWTIWQRESVIVISYWTQSLQQLLWPEMYSLVFRTVVLGFVAQRIGTEKRKIIKFIYLLSHGSFLNLWSDPQFTERFESNYSPALVSRLLPQVVHRVSESCWSSYHSGIEPRCWPRPGRDPCKVSPLRGGHLTVPNFILLPSAFHSTLLKTFKGARFLLVTI